MITEGLLSHFALLDAVMSDASEAFPSLLTVTTQFFHEVIQTCSNFRPRLPKYF